MRQPRSGDRSAIAGLLLGLALIGAPGAAEAEKLHAAVGARFEAPPAALVSGLTLDVALVLTAFDDAPDVEAELLPSDGIRVVAGVARWTGALGRGHQIGWPLTLEVSGAGEHALGARITVRRAGRVETVGALLSVRSTGADVVVAADPLEVLRLRSATSPAELRGLGVARESAPAREPRILRPNAAPPAAGGRTITGQIRWRDPEGGFHPVRLAYVEVVDADTGAVLARPATDATGTYLASVTAERVRVVAYSRDAEGRRAAVTAPGDPGLGFVLESPPTPLAAPVTVVDVTSAITIRGRPGSPSADSLAARAFSVYDAVVTYWVQAASMIGADPPPARVVFPASTTSGCGTTCYVDATAEIFALREDAFDWDVLGHEFFHFLAARATARPIDDNPGGSHSGGSAIGMPPRPGAPGRTRDEGMRLAWSEGLATFMSLVIQAMPSDSTFDFPRSLASVGDRRYQDTEDVEVTLDAEAPADSGGFGSPNSVLGLLWDFFDAEVDGPVDDTNQGIDARFLWRLLTHDLPCSPCDRVDRIWTAVTRALGIADPRTLAVARSFAQNLIAPRAVSPPAGVRLSPSAPPTFSWDRNGDPDPAHRNDRFALVISRDGFRSHVALIDVPTPDAVSYTPSVAEWGAAVSGSATGAALDWMVVGLRHDDPVVPEGWLWYSNTLRFTLAD